MRILRNRSSEITHVFGREIQKRPITNWYTYPPYILLSPRADPDVRRPRPKIELVDAFTELPLLLVRACQGSCACP
jgi:hypothetical protein